MSFQLIPEEIPTEKLVGFINNRLPTIEKTNPFIKEKVVTKDTMILENLLLKQEVDSLKDFFFNNYKVCTKQNTIQLSYGTETQGIERSSFYDKVFAINFSKRINKFLNDIEQNTYQLIGINPLIRFIHYHKKNQKLIPHYDNSVQLNDSVLTLKTLIIYLNNSNSGHTNFLKDTRNKKEIDSFGSFPIIFQQKPIEGLGIIFNHGVFHESENIEENDKKLIITTEICYKKII